MATRATQVVVIGCGYAGTAVASGLDAAVRRRLVEVTVVAPHATLVRTPALGALVAGRVEVGAGVCTPLHVLAPRARHVPGTAEGIDAEARRVWVGLLDGTTRELAYDHLVVTVGGAWEDRHVPGASAHCLGLRGVGDALELRRRVLHDLALASMTTDAEERRRLSTVAVVGGGLGGVSAATAVADLQAGLVHGWGGHSRDDVRVVLVEAKARLVAHMPRDLCDAVESTLARAGVEVVTQDAVTRVEAGAVIRRSGASVAAGTVVWAAGNRAALAAGLLKHADFSSGGRLVVSPQLQVGRAPDVWAAGDAAAVPQVLDGGDCPATAEFATAAGRRVARNILRVLDGNFPMALRYRPMTEVVPLAAATLTRARGRVMSGIPATLMSNTPAVVGRRIAGTLRSLRRQHTPPSIPLERSVILATESTTATAITLTRRKTGSG